MSQPDRYPDVIANYWLEEVLGSGYSGSIFRAVNIHTGQRVALKLQDIDHECPTNRYERYFYPALQGGQGMPTLWTSGVQGKWDYLAIDLLGPSLDSLFRKSGRNVMDLRSVLCIAMQVISRLEWMHSRGVLHRDIQLGNCVIGLPPHDKLIYMIDFGFSKFYIDPATNKHIEDSKAKRDFVGNYWFSSVRVHCRGKVPSRRDDLEALALMLIHLLTPGGLSWTRHGVPDTDNKHERLKKEKRSAKPEDLCRGLPEEFEEFLRYCRRLKFAERPDYEIWVQKFRDLAVESDFPSGSQFIWPPPMHESARAPLSRRTPAAVEGILQDLANIQIDERPFMDRKTLAELRAKHEVDKESNTGSHNVIIISDDENAAPGAPAGARLPKAMHLAKLTKLAAQATDNLALAALLEEFIAVLQDNRSKNLTKEGFAFLDSVHKQLSDPSVYLQPMRTSRSRSGEEAAQPLQPRQVKMNKLWGLRRDVAQAKSNAMLAKMVAEFGAVINKSGGRTVTKDGFGFLEGLAKRLRTIA